MEGDRRDARLGDQAMGEVDAAGVAGHRAGAQLDRHRLAAALAGRPRDRDGRVGILEHRGARAGLADLGHRAAHVEVDDVDLRDVLGHVGRGGAHDVGVLPEELQRRGAFVGMDAQQLGERLLVAVVDGEARHHLAVGHPRAVARRLQAHEPVADAGQRREQHAVGHADAGELPGVGEGGARRRHGGLRIDAPTGTSTTARARRQARTRPGATARSIRSVAPSAPSQCRSSAKRIPKVCTQRQRSSRSANGGGARWPSSPRRRATRRVGDDDRQLHAALRPAAGRSSPLGRPGAVARLSSRCARAAA